MDIDKDNSPPVCQKPCTLPLKHYSWVQQEIETLEQAVMQTQRQVEKFLLSCYQKLMKCMVDYEVQKSSLHWI